MSRNSTRGSFRSAGAASKQSGFQPRISISCGCRKIRRAFCWALMRFITECPPPQERIVTEGLCGGAQFREGRTRECLAPDTALRLARVTGMSADFWLGLQQDWDL